MSMYIHIYLYIYIYIYRERERERERERGREGGCKKVQTGAGYDCAGAQALAHDGISRIPVSSIRHPQLQGLVCQLSTVPILCENSFDFKTISQGDCGHFRDNNLIILSQVAKIALRDCFQI